MPSAPTWRLAIARRRLLRGCDEFRTSSAAHIVTVHAGQVTLGSVPGTPDRLVQQLHPSCVCCVTVNPEKFQIGVVQSHVTPFAAFHCTIVVSLLSPQRSIC